MLWFSRNPVLAMIGRTHGMNFVFTQKERQYVKAEYVAYEARDFIFSVPITSDLGCVFLIKYRVKEGLLWQSRRKVSKSGCSD